MNDKVERTLHGFQEAKSKLYNSYQDFLSTVALAADKFISMHHEIPEGMEIPERLLKRMIDTDDKRMADSAIVIARVAIDAYRNNDMDLISRLFNNRLTRDDVGMFYDVVVDHGALAAFRIYVEYYLNKEEQDG